MAKGAIKGITIEIGAETKEFTKSLEEINKETKNTQNELREVDRLLKFDPTNTELLQQKQELLAQQLENTAKKTDILRQADEKLKESFDNGKISADDYAESHRNIQRQLIDTEQKSNKLNDEVNRLGIKFDEIGGKAIDAGKKMTAIASTAIIGGVVALSESTEELANDLAKLETNATVADVGLDTVDQAMQNLSAISDETDSNVEAVSNLLATGFDDNQLLEAIDALSGAVIQFPDTLKIESLSDSLEETLATGEATGQFGEMIERLGLSLEDFNEGLAAAQESGEATNYVLDYLAQTGLANVNAEFQKNNQAIVENNQARYNLQVQLMSLGNIVRPIITSVIEKITELLTWFNNLDSSTQKIIGLILAVIAAIGPLLTIIGSVISILPVLGAAFTALTGPIGIIIAAIAGIVAILVLVSTHFDEIKEKCHEVFTSVQEKMAEAWEKIKETFDKFAKKLKDDFLTLLNNIKTLVLNFVPNMFSAGVSLFNGVWDGMKNIWSSLESWVSDKVNWLIDKLAFWRKGQSEIAADEARNADGSHALGLRYVPYDGYRAILHQGETVLSRGEANAYRRDEVAKGGDTYITQTFYGNKTTAKEQQRELKKVMIDLAKAV